MVKIGMTIIVIAIFFQSLEYIDKIADTLGVDVELLFKKPN